MMEILITLVPSVCWILYRCFQILKTPVEEIINDLNIEIPHSPNLCIDSISETSIVIHWDIEVKYDENIYYVLVINGKEAATITSTSCRLNNLSPKQIYQLQIVAINSLTNFRSQSKPVFVHTINKKDSKLRFIYDDKFEDSEITISNTEKLLVEENHKDDDEKRHLVDIDNLSVVDIQKVSNSDILKDYLLCFQNELIKVNQELKSYQASIVKESEELNKEHQFYKQEYDEETDTKLKKDSDVKSLEKSKDKLTFKKSKLANQLNAIKSSMEMFDSKLLNLKTKIKKLEERNSLLLNNEDLEKQKINNEINDINSEIDNIKKDNDNIEESLKTIQVEKKELSAILQHLKPLIDIFNAPPALPNGVAVAAHVRDNDNITSHNTPSSSASPSPAPQAISSIFLKDGSINKNIYEVLYKIFEIVPSWQDDILKEINTYQEFENNWKEAFQTEIKRYVTLHQTLQIAKQNLDENYQPIKLSEYQASIEFGGFGNALAKPKFSGKRNFSPSLDDNNEGKNRAQTNVNFHNHYGQVYSHEAENLSGDNFHHNEPISAQIEPVLDQQLYTGVPSTIASHQPLHTNDFDQQMMSSPILVSPLLEQHQTQQSQNISNANAMQGFPYDDSVYKQGISSPIQENAQPLMNYDSNFNSLLYNYNSPVMSQATLGTTPVSSGIIGAGVWSTPSTASATGNIGATSNLGTANSRGGLGDLFASNQNHSVSSLNPVNSNDISLLQHRANYGGPTGNVDNQGFLMTPSSSSKLWMDVNDSFINGNNGNDLAGNSAIGMGHTRTVSNNSQIWRNDNIATTHNFNLGGVGGDFSPFGTSIHFPTNLSNPPGSALSPRASHATNALYNGLATSTSNFGQPLESSTLQGGEEFAYNFANNSQTHFGDERKEYGEAI